ncbi:hypothetical protein [Lapillicoccus sp.]|uniref:hypothetical protein n=1 Tax=Lapillicoccus sp. TaxID=1909287 RepID=UPI003983BDC7
MEQQPEHEDAGQVGGPATPWTRPGGSVSGVALGEVSGDLASWKSAPGRGSAAALAASTECTGDAGGVDPSGAQASPTGSVPDWLQVAQCAAQQALAEPARRHSADGLAAAMRSSASSGSTSQDVRRLRGSPTDSATAGAESAP